MPRNERLATLLADPGFTPKTKDIVALIDLLADAEDELADKTTSALLRKPHEARTALAARLTIAFGSTSAKASTSTSASTSASTSTSAFASTSASTSTSASAFASTSAFEAFMVRVGGLASRLGGTELVEALLPWLAHDNKRARKAAGRALGKMQDARIEAALADAFERATEVDERKVLADALGKVGGARALSLLERATVTDDPLLVEKQMRAKLAIGRTMRRSTRGAIDASRAPKEALPIVWRCRDGLEALLATELASFAPKSTRPGRVEGDLHVALSLASAARLASEVSFPLPTEPVANDDIADAVVGSLTGPSAAHVFDAFTPAGDITVRVAWHDGGHRRSVAWRIAELLEKHGGRLKNDPRDATWEAEVRVFREGVRLELLPKSLQDTRFSYRLRDVPAASHPTIAAALAMVAAPRPGDVVWDPFCGSGSELVECAFRAKGLTLIGSDNDDKALDAARANVDAAHVSATLEKGDALTFEPPKTPNLIVTNPPMGRRVHRSADLGSMLDAFVARCAVVLPRGGALVWLAPMPDESRAAAAKAKLSVTYSRRVDLGGFFADLMRLEKA